MVTQVPPQTSNPDEIITSSETVGFPRKNNLHVTGELGVMFLDDHIEFEIRISNGSVFNLQDFR